MDADLLRRGGRRSLDQGVTKGPAAPLLRTGEPPPSRPQQTRSLDKRRRLLEAARILFGERGYEAASIEEITSRAGMAAGAFYTYFRSKRQLLVVLMNELLGHLSELDLSPGSSASLRGGLRGFLASVFRADLEFYSVVRAWDEASLADPELAGMRMRIEAWTEVRILRVFQTLQKYPKARSDRDLPSFARMMDRHFWSLLARGSSMPSRQFAREVGIAADVIHHYLFRD